MRIQRKLALLKIPFFRYKNYKFILLLLLKFLIYLDNGGTILFKLNLLKTYINI